MGRLRRVVVIALAAASVALGAGCHEGAAEPGPNDGSSLDFTSRATVIIGDDGISPSSVQVEVGDAITVVNNGARDHGLTSDTVDTGTLRPGESTVVFLTEAGTVEAYDRDDIDRKLEIYVSADAS